ncbi:DMT family transporter [Agrococcus sp. BE272]|uniref:DMT family transporter n=1 Tax=Agrococcus sp. BE272 TaxID=2817727 RepID=UPI00285462BB|nr:DMT family transporter [Agrococcus sp. BE272]MDR7233215.1 transporter family-2 protein [Agrococcus sp. BE272]
MSRLRPSSTQRDAAPGLGGLLWVLASVTAGTGLAIQSRINGELGARLEHGMLAALISFGVGLAVLAALLAVSPGIRAGVRRLVGVLRDGTLPWWFASTGLFGAFLVATQGLVVGTTGVALYTVGVVAGQTVSGLLIDRLGIGGLARKHITPQRVLGALLALVAVGVALVGAGRLEGAWLVVLPFIAGLLQSVQQAFGGIVQRRSGSAMAQTVSNFLVGTIALGAIVLVQTAAGVTAQPLPTEPWLYAGGLLGIMFIALMSVAVHHLGVLTMGLGVICGQVVTSLLLDALLPAGHPVTVWSLIGAALTIVAVAVSAMRRRRPRVSPRA